MQGIPGMQYGAAQMMEYAMIASGSKGNCFVMRDGTTSLMIDCGTTKKYLMASFDRLGFSRDEIDALLITHDHSDHVSQIRHFRDLSIYSPVELPDIDTFHVQPLKPFVLETLKITPLALSHDALNTTGYVIESGTEKLVYVTDTGYLNQRYLPFLKGADHIIMESNHDVGMLMRTARPQYLKARIYSDQGHLCNEDCASILNEIITEKTESVVLAHISQEANTREKALEVTVSYLRENHRGPVSRNLVISAAGQNEIIRRRWNHEEMDPGTVSCAFGLEYPADLWTVE